jgi:pimeloyl-ACP methyl ester carboxylesterase
MDRLAERFRLIYYDQRGSGRSEVGDPGKLNLSGTIEDLDAVRESFGIDEANIIGHSIGANIALLYASRHPDQVASLVLANPGPPFDPQQQHALGAEMGRRMTAADEQAMHRIQESEGLQKRDSKTVEEFIRTMYLPFFRDRASAQEIIFGFTQISADNVLAIDVNEGLARVKAPTLVLRGELEPIPDAFPRFLADNIPGARFEVIEGANHFAYFEDPEPFLAAVNRFLNEHAR